MGYTLETFFGSLERKQMLGLVPRNSNPIAAFLSL